MSRSECGAASEADQESLSLPGTRRRSSLVGRGLPPLRSVRAQTRRSTSSSPSLRQPSSLARPMVRLHLGSEVALELTLCRPLPLLRRVHCVCDVYCIPIHARDDRSVSGEVCLPLAMAWSLAHRTNQHRIDKTFEGSPYAVKWPTVFLSSRTSDLRNRWGSRAGSSTVPGESRAEFKTNLELNQLKALSVVGSAIAE